MVAGSPKCILGYRAWVWESTPIRKIKWKRAFKTKWAMSLYGGVYGIDTVMFMFNTPHPLILNMHGEEFMKGVCRFGLVDLFS